jgi:hypothetical protein
MLRKVYLRAEDFFNQAGMRLKVKAVVGFAQCIAAIPSVFDVAEPEGLDQYTRWMKLIEAPAELSNLAVPADCFGSYRRHAQLVDTPTV